jgi:hypothetical protein
VGAVVRDDHDVRGVPAVDVAVAVVVVELAHHRGHHDVAELGVVAEGADLPLDHGVELAQHGLMLAALVDRDLLADLDLVAIAEMPEVRDRDAGHVRGVQAAQGITRAVRRVQDVVGTGGQRDEQEHDGDPEGLKVAAPGACP